MSYIFVSQGAKNHGVVMPDANKENTLNQLVGAAFGAAGQRCMALSTAILVGEARDWIPELVERSKVLRVNAGNPHSNSVNTISPLFQKTTKNLKKIELFVFLLFFYHFILYDPSSYVNP